MANLTRNQRLALAFERFMNAAEAAKLGTASQRKRWDYSTGSRYYGNSFQLYQVGADSKDRLYGGEPSKAYPFGSGHYQCATLPQFLGWTTDEAIATLDAYTAALYAVSAQRKARRS